MGEPLAVAVHAVRLVNGEKEKPLVILGSGTIGLLSLIIAREQGYMHIICTDTAAFNRRMALELGAAAAYDPIHEDVVKAVRESTGGRGASAVIITAGAPNIVDQASDLTREFGSLVLVSMIMKPIPVYTYGLVFKEQTLFGSMTYTSNDFAKACDIINKGLNLDSIITHKLPLEETQKGLTILDQKQENVVKVLIHP